MSDITVNGVRLNYVEFNKDATETVVMVHGMFTNMAVFYFKIAQRLASHFHVVLYDLRGHGLSEIAASGYELKSMTDDLLCLMDALQIPKAHVVGYSFGGLIALFAACKHPERVMKLSVIEAPNPDNTEPRELLRHYSRSSLELYTELLSHSTGLKPRNRQLDKLDKQQQMLMYHSTLVEDMSVYQNFFQEIIRDNLDKELLLLYGKQSICLSSGEYLHKHIPHSLFYTSEGDHNIPVQNPQWISERLVEFLLGGQVPSANEPLV